MKKNKIEKLNHLTPTLSVQRGRKGGFTLAEVLITLGIIGVVAALTIPTLVANYQAKSWNTAASNFEAKFGETLRVMNTQQSLANLKTTERFVEELQKHMKIIKTCDNMNLSECFSDIEATYTTLDVIAKKQVSYQGKTKKVEDLTTAESVGQSDWGTNTMGLQFANGVTALIAYNPKCSANPFDSNSVTLAGSKDGVSFVTDCVAVVYDTSGFASPNERGKDIRLSAKADLGDGGCVFRIGSKCVTKVVQPTFITWNACTAEGTSEDSEDIKRISDLGLTYCMDPSRGKNDYWAGIVEACGGKDKVASMSDLEKVARYVYNDDSIVHTKRQYGFTLDTNKVAEVGLKGNNFYVWANTETFGTRGANDFAFAGSGMVGADWFNRDARLQGICIGE